MRKSLPLLVGSLAFSSLVLAQTPETPIVFDGDVSVNNNADGGLAPVVGVQNIQVFRSNRGNPDHADGLAHTYLHAPMLAYWRGAFHLDYLSAPVHEHDSPTDTSYTSSPDGVTWSPPRTLFPAYQLPDGSWTLNHQRTSFFIAPDERLLATAFYGEAPNPNDGNGIGRAVREIKADGSFGPIYFLRYNRQPTWDPAKAKAFPFYSDSPDSGFVAACNALLANKLHTAQWWEEDQSEDGFYREKGKALSYYHLPSGKVVGIWKHAVTMTSDDEGESWIRTGFATNVPRNASKYWAQKLSDDRYALVFNPTTRLRHPLAIGTSNDGKTFSNLLAVHGELPAQRFYGYYRNMGPQYVRGILEGNGNPPDGNLWLTYSVNKEDIWVSRVPVPVASVVEGPVHDDFQSASVGSMPPGWNVYRPIWAPSAIVSENSSNQVLQLSDADPYDYASVTRVFPDSRSALIRFKLKPAQISGRLEIDVASADGQRPVQIAFTDDGAVLAKHEGIWKSAGHYVANKWIMVELDVNPGKDTDRFQLRIDGREVLRRIAYFSELPATVHRLTIRTGPYRQRGEGNGDLPGADTKSPLKSFWIDDVSIEPRP